MEVVLPVAPVALVIHFFQSLQAFIFGALTSLPCGPVEPTTIALCQNSPRESSLHDSGVAYAFGSLIAPCGVRSGDVRVRCLPGFVCIGRPLRFKLALSADYPCRAPAELNIALASIAFHARASVFLLRESESPQQLMMQTTLTLEHASSENGRDNGNSGRNIEVTVVLPQDARKGDEVVIRDVTFAGQVVSEDTVLEEAVSEAFPEYIAIMPFRAPVRLPIVTGMHAPLLLNGAVPEFYLFVPVITSDGTLYAPMNNRVLVFAADGTLQPPLLPTEYTGFCADRFDNRLAETRVAAFVESTNTLLLARCFNDNNSDVSNLVAVDTVRKTICWSAAFESCNGINGIAVLPSRGVVVVCNYQAAKLDVHSLADGTFVASLEDVVEPIYVVADTVSATVYVSVMDRESGNKNVVAFCWNGAAMVFDGVVETFDSSAHHPLAVVPPAPGNHTSYLVVGSYLSAILRVFSLPDRRLVHIYELKKIKVRGLAADPSGTALAVCDGTTRAIIVLPWPLRRDAIFHLSR